MGIYFYKEKCKKKKKNNSVLFTQNLNNFEIMCVCPRVLVERSVATWDRVCSLLQSCETQELNAGH